MNYLRAPSLPDDLLYRACRFYMDPLDSKNTRGFIYHARRYLFRAPAPAPLHADINTHIPALVHTLRYVAANARICELVGMSTSIYSRWFLSKRRLLFCKKVRVVKKLD
jgi:hypothetical protein